MFTLARPEAYGAAGLAIAQSIVSASEVAVLGTVLFFRDRQMFTRELLDTTFRLISVTGFTIIAAFIMISLLPLNLNDRGFFVLGSKLSAIAFVTLSVHVLVSTVFGFEEGKDVLRKIKKIILKPIRL